MDGSGHDVPACTGFPARHRAKLHRTDVLDKGFVRGGRSGGRGPERPPRVWRRPTPTGSRRPGTARRLAPTRPGPTRRSGPGGATLPWHGRPRGE
jgi:hypothetical protein